MAIAPSGHRPQAKRRGATLTNNWPVFFLACAVFFLLGGVTNMNDALVAKFKHLFSLTFADAMLAQFAFFLSYGLFSIPAGLIMKRLGYVRGFVLGFAIIAGACLLFLPAANAAKYSYFLFALFMIGAGITLLQVAMNPLAISLGDPANASSRLTFAQFFNSIGVSLMVWKGGEIILGSSSDTNPEALSGAALQAFRVSESAIIGHTYAWLAGIIIVVGLFFWFFRKVLDQTQVDDVDTKGLLALFLSNRQLMFGCICIFLYVGAEVSIASIMINYLGEKRTWGLDPQSANFWLTMYWTGALLGRLAGGFIHWFVGRPGAVLAAFAMGAVCLCAASALGGGSVAAYSIITVGLMNSLMFSTIFALAVDGLNSKEAPQASGLLCTAIVGGAIVPWLTGMLADATGLATSLAIPMLCYIIIVIFGVSAKTSAQDVR
jgi:MFS transporter, FHS family, L-fucose permease